MNNGRIFVSALASAAMLGGALLAGYSDNRLPHNRQHVITPEGVSQSIYHRNLCWWIIPAFQWDVDFELNFGHHGLIN